jgi:outer membrane protein
MNFYLDSQLDLFRGFTRVNSAKFQKLHYLISREEAKQQEMAIAFEVMNKYYDVLYFNKLQTIVHEQVELTALNLQKTQKMITLGLQAESDLLEMKAQESSELHNLTLVQNQYEQALLALKNLMHYPLDDDLEIKDGEFQDSADSFFSPDEVYLIALGHMPSVQSANLNAEASLKQFNLARGSLMPQLSLGAGLYSNYADSRKEAVDPNNPNSAMVTVPFQNQFSQNMAQSVYLSLQIPIFNTWRGMSKVKRARLEHTMALNTQQDEKQNLYRLISEDIQQVNALQKERDLLQAKKELLREAFAVSEKKLEQGLISVLEFYTAKNQLAQAEADWMRTILQLNVKERTIRFYMGEEYY